MTNLNLAAFTTAWEKRGHESIGDFKGLMCKKSTSADGTDSSADDQKDLTSWLSMEEWVKSSDCFWSSWGLNWAPKSRTTEGTPGVQSWLEIKLFPPHLTLNRDCCPAQLCFPPTCTVDFTPISCKSTPVFVFAGKKMPQHTKLIYIRFNCLICNRPTCTGETFCFLEHTLLAIHPKLN